MKLLLIVNPSASSVTPRSQVLIQRAFNRVHDVELVETTRRGHATRLAADAAFRGFDGAIVLGGDGTLNEAANGLVGTSTALIPLPGGSTNVFARTLGLPDDPLEATGPLLQALGEGRITRVGLGVANDRHFLFHAGVGFDAAVVEQVERNADLKRYLSHPLFVYAAIKTWMRHYDRSSPHFRVTFPNAETINDGYFAVVLNTNPYTYLGSIPLDVAPEATLDRGLAAITISSLRADRVLRLSLGALLGDGRRTRSRFLDYRHDLSEFSITSDTPFPHQLDGDFVGRVTRIDFRHEPDVLDLVRPDQLI